MNLFIIASIALILICGLVARHAKKGIDAFIALLTTLIAALLAVSLYLFSVRSSDDASRVRLRHLLGIELAETQKAVGANAALWRKLGPTGEASPKVYLSFAPRLVAVEAFKSGLFPAEEELLLQYLLALENYNKIIETHLGAYALGKIPGGASSGLGMRIILSGADPVDRRATKLLERLRINEKEAGW